jgi:D-alanyl-D-alanine carboxypeptidase
MIVELDVFDKVHKKLADYWFILRYPDGKEKITGYEYEPWHLRYIWDVSIAKEIMENGLTLEEYLNNKWK